MAFPLREKAPVSKKAMILLRTGSVICQNLHNLFRTGDIICTSLYILKYLKYYPKHWCQLEEGPLLDFGGALGFSHNPV